MNNSGWEKLIKVMLSWPELDLQQAAARESLEADRATATSAPDSESERKEFYHDT